MGRSVLLLMLSFIIESFSAKYAESACYRPSGSFPDPRLETGDLKNGPWRAMLERKDGHSIIFNFEVKDSAGKKILYIRNAGEHLLVDDIKIEGDSVLIHLPFFESQLRSVLTKDGNLEGVWLKRGANGYQSVPFRAYYGEAFRFPASRAAAGASGAGAATTGTGLSGRWKAVFLSPDGKDTSIRVGEFEQKGQQVTGTFLDPTGDFRYLEGVVDGDSLKLSCFDGGHAFLFTARVEGKVLSGGQYFSGAAARETWTALKDASAKLPDEFSLTKWKKDAGPLNFSFRDIDGNTVSLSDDRFKGKVVLIQIMGSWCPNCMDETHFLSGFYDQYHSKGVEIIGLAYERTTDFARSQNSLRSFQQRFQVKYPMLITGVTVSDPKNAQKTLPLLEDEAIVGFPTTIFIDKMGNIQKIHTGFNGPGTGAHYEAQQKEFYQIVDGLLGE
jgi:thiol-disulfide isomerase/thioredoxin